MIRVAFLCLFCLTVTYPLSAQEDSTFLVVARKGDAFLLPGNKKLKIYGGFDKPAKVELNGNVFKSPLKFKIVPDVTTAVYYLKSKLYEVVVIQSHIPSPSGLSANILNLTFLQISDNKIVKAEYANSFFGGADDITVMHNGLSIKVLEFNGYAEDNSPICCATDFVLTRDFKFEKMGKTSCVKYDGPKKLIPITCKCTGEHLPLVFDY